MNYSTNYVALIAKKFKYFTPVWAILHILKYYTGNYEQISTKIQNWSPNSRMMNRYVSCRVDYPGALTSPPRVLNAF